MKLMTKAIEKKLPGLYATEELPAEEKVVQVKFFSPYTGWTWYGVEYSPEDKLFFGLVQGFEQEWGYFSLEELESARGAGGKLPLVERDECFKPKTIGELGLA